MQAYQTRALEVVAEGDIAGYDTRILTLGVLQGILADKVLDRLAECLHGHFDLEHSTFQLEQATHFDHEAVLHA